MVDHLLQLFREYQQLAIIISLFISIVIAILGLVPSVFVTAANILFFGFWYGTAISFAGEAIGAGIAFILYRKGFKRRLEKSLDQFPKLSRLIKAEGRPGWMLVFSLRLLPFVPSGLITFAAAIGKLNFIHFITASSLGKIPALLLEAYSVYEVSRFSWQGKLILITVAVVLLIWIIKKISWKPG
ncbi:MAG: VTT domain-containing protein [Ferruginibacter sp.]